MYRGSYVHNLDSAGRVTLPKAVRSQIGLKFYIAKGVGCLCVFDEAWKNELERQLTKMGSPLQQLLNPDVARLNRHFFSGMQEVSIDGQNRVQLSPEHRRYAGITDEVVICGCGQYVEMWEPEALAVYWRTQGRVEDLVASGVELLPRKSEQAPLEKDDDVPQAGPD